MKKLFLLLLFFVVLFIWINSMMPSGLSNEFSNSILKLLGGTVTYSREEAKQATTLFNSENVRKLAHFLEYAAFGCLAEILKLKYRRRLADILLFGLSIAVIDETIQLFDGRTSSIKDIWIDMAGFLFAILIVWIMNIMIDWIDKRRGTHS
jgi:VanZ family protein